MNVFSRSTAVHMLAMALVAGCMLTACTNDDEPVIPVERSYSDPSADLEAFKQQVLSATNGWEGNLSPQPGKMYHLFLQLDGQGKVSLYADVDTTAARVATTTAYRIETTQKVNPTLVLEPGSSLDRIVIASTKRHVDLAYSFKSAQGDTLRLLGNEFGDELVLVKAPRDHRDRYAAQALKNTMKGVAAYMSTVRYFYLQPEPDKLIQLMINPLSRDIYVTYLNQGAKFFGSDYAYSLDGIALNAPLNAVGYKATEIFWDQQAQVLYTYYNNARVDLKTSPIPVIPLHYLLGNEYPPGTIVLSTYLEKLPGWSVRFQALWLKDDDALFTEEISLYYIVFDLHVDANTMDLYVYYVLDDIMHRGKFPYTFTKTTDGIFDFTPQKIDDNDDDAADAHFIDGKMPNVFDVINNHRFHIEFFDANATLGGPIPQYISVDDPGIYFTGYFYQ
jgi:hypothetical protein